MAVPPDGTTLAYNSLRMSTGETWLEHHLQAMKTFSADSGFVYVWEPVGLPLYRNQDQCGTVS